MIWYGIGGALRFAKIWYIGPPRRGDSENIPHRVGFLFLTIYKLCKVPFRHHYKNIYARRSIHHFESTITMRSLTHKEEEEEEEIRAAPAHAIPPSHMGIILQKCWFCCA